MPVIQEPIAVSLENILLATDFTVGAERAAEYAKGLALRFGATLELAHVFDPSVTTSWVAAELEIPPEERMSQSKERLNDWQKHISTLGIATKVVCRPAHRPAAALLEIAREDKIDLIVAGTQSKVGIERLVLGSTAEQLIRNANCPVLTIGPKAKRPVAGPLRFNTVVYANDFSPEATKAAVYAFSFAEDSGARLYCCYAVQDDGRHGDKRADQDKIFQEALQARIPKSSYDWCTPECVVEHGNPAKAILELAKRVGADLIVLGARRSSFWLTRVERGLTPALLAEATCPVLTVC